MAIAKRGDGGAHDSAITPMTVRRAQVNQLVARAIPRQDATVIKANERDAGGPHPQILVMRALFERMTGYRLIGV